MRQKCSIKFFQVDFIVSSLQLLYASKLIWRVRATLPNKSRSKFTYLERPYSKARQNVSCQGKRWETINLTYLEDNARCFRASLCEYIYCLTLSCTQRGFKEQLYEEARKYLELHTLDIFASHLSQTLWEHFHFLCQITQHYVKLPIWHKRCNSSYVQLITKKPNSDFSSLWPQTKIALLSKSNTSQY